MAAATKDAFAAAKAAEAQAAADAAAAAEAAKAEAARAWEEDPLRWSDFTLEVLQGADTLTLGVRHLAWRAIVERRVVQRAVDEAAKRPVTEDGDEDLVAAHVATVQPVCLPPPPSPGF